MDTDTLDVLLVGGGIVSATLASMLQRVEPEWSVAVYERLDDVGAESSDGWNNAGTGHAALCELNYTPQRQDGSVNIDKAVQVHAQYLSTLQYWSSLVREQALKKPGTFISSTPHMSFVRGEKDKEFLAARHQALSRHHFFEAMRYSDDQATVQAWAPLLMNGRDPSEPVAATFAPEGTDVDFGQVTRQIFQDFRNRGGQLSLSTAVSHLRQDTDGTWLATVKDRKTGQQVRRRARTVIVGAGGWTLKLLRSAGIPQVRGYGLLPVSGTFLSTTDASVTDHHRVKVYGQAPTGAPPMSMPHLAARRINGESSVLFGPFAGAKPKFLKQGSLWDFAGSIRWDNLWPLATMGTKNLPLVGLLLRDLLSTHSKKLTDLKEFAPLAAESDWSTIVAGQRAQIVKPGAKGQGELQFGTEVISSSDGTLAGVLGASPGASTAVPIALDILQRSFTSRFPRWERRALSDYIPHFGSELLSGPSKTRKVKEAVTETLFPRT